MLKSGTSYLGRKIESKLNPVSQKIKKPQKKVKKKQKKKAQVSTKIQKGTGSIKKKPEIKKCNSHSHKSKPKLRDIFS